MSQSVEKKRPNKRHQIQTSKVVKRPSKDPTWKWRPDTYLTIPLGTSPPDEEKARAHRVSELTEKVAKPNSPSLTVDQVQGPGHHGPAEAAVVKKQPLFVRQAEDEGVKAITIPLGNGNLDRKFINAAGVTSNLPGPSTVRVVSYNILSDTMAETSSHSYAPLAVRKWPKRWERLKAELDHFDGDIVCLQEVNEAMAKEIQPYMHDRGYSLEGGVTGSLGNMLFFRASKFRRVDVRVVQFNRLYREARTNLMYRPNTRPSKSFQSLMDERQQSCVMVLLMPMDGTNQICVANTHLYHHPKFPEIKAMQAYLGLLAIRHFLSPVANKPLSAITPQILSEPPKPAIILCGDFNSMPVYTKSDLWNTLEPGERIESGVYSLIKSGELTENHKQHPAHPHRSKLPAPKQSVATSGLLHREPPGQGGEPNLTRLYVGYKLTSAYESVIGEEPPFTTRCNGFSATLDYIWFSDGFKAERVLETPQHPEFPDIPDALGVYPSDHIPLVADIRPTRG